MLINQLSSAVGQLANDVDREDDEIGGGGSTGGRDSVFLISGLVLLH